MDKDLIDVREEEKLDATSLIDYLDNVFPEIDTKTLNIKQFGGGAANLTYELKFDTRTLVLRRPPLGKVAKSAHDMAREHKVLSVLHDKFPYAPQSFHYCDDLSIIGSDFFIMERKYGTVIRATLPENLTQIPNIGKQISEAMVDTLAKFHKVDYEKLGLSDLGKPEGFISRQIEGWYRRWNGSKLKDNSGMDDLYDWLVKNQPESYPFSLVHNDYKLDNIMLDSSNTNKVVAVFDWDMTTLGTPMSDLGSMLTYWINQDDPQYFKQTAMMPLDDVGFYSRDQLKSRYAQKTGFSKDNINFYHALGLFRLTVIISQIYYRFVKKQTKDKRFAAFGPMIPLIVKKANEIALEE